MQPRISRPVRQDSARKINDLKLRPERLGSLTVKLNEEAPYLEGVALKAVALKCTLLGIQVGDGSMLLGSGMEMLGAIRYVRADL